MKYPLHGIFVIRRSEYLLDDELSSASHNDRIIPEISMFEKDAIVLFVDANSILDETDAAVLSGEISIEIMDPAFAVASEFEGVGHVSSPILSEVKGVLSLMRAFRVAAKVMLT